MSSGEPEDKFLRLREKLSADELRMKACAYMSEHPSEFDIPGGLSSDQPANIHFSTLEERINAMSDPTTHAGEFELLALAKSINISLHVFSNGVNHVFGNGEKRVSIRYTNLGGATGHYDFIREQ